MVRTQARSDSSRRIDGDQGTMTGKAIEHVTPREHEPDSALLHEVCWECPLQDAPRTKGPPILIDFRLMHDSSSRIPSSIRA